MTGEIVGSEMAGEKATPIKCLQTAKHYASGFMFDPHNSP